MPLPRTPLTGATVYADDVAVWATAQTPVAAWALLEPRLQEMVEWGRCWRLRFSAEKTQLICLSRRKRPSFPSVFFDGAQLQWASHLDLLGVRLDPILRFRQHALNVCQRLRPKVMELRRLTAASRAVPVWVGVLLYKSLVRSSLLYAVPTLTMALESTWQMMEKLERHALRAALRLSLFWRTPRSEVYRRTRIEPLRGIATEQAASFLRRHVRSRNRRLLSSFAAEVHQASAAVYLHGPLERAFSCVPPQERGQMVTVLRQLGVDEQWFATRPTTQRQTARMSSLQEPFNGLCPFQ